MADRQEGRENSGTKRINPSRKCSTNCVNFHVGEFDSVSTISCACGRSLPGREVVNRVVAERMYASSIASSSGQQHATVRLMRTATWLKRQGKRISRMGRWREGKRQSLFLRQRLCWSWSLRRVEDDDEGVDLGVVVASLVGNRCSFRAERSLARAWAA